MPVTRCYGSQTHKELQLVPSNDKPEAASCWGSVFLSDFGGQDINALNKKERQRVLRKAIEEKVQRDNHGEK
jgi:hypothetical protein